MPGTLDQKLIDLCSDIKNLEREYQRYKARKQDFFQPRKVKIPVGVDGITSEFFEKELQRHLRTISLRLAGGKYHFSPFREVLIPKDIHLSVDEAVQLGRVRVISVGCIKDVLAQQLLYQVLEPYAEEKFQKLPGVSYAYRKGSSPQQAARQVHRWAREGYHYVLDADIKSFFDEIPHDLLMEALEGFFGADNPLVLKYLHRFLSVDRVPWESYAGQLRHFFSNKPDRHRRNRGIPQGGSISGLLANVYMHDFDAWALSTQNELGNLDRKYIRYADDFLFLLKEPGPMQKLQENIREKLASKGLSIHSDPKKCKTIHLLSEPVEYVGFSISPSGIAARRSNVQNFKKKVRAAIQKRQIAKDAPDKDLEKLVQKVNLKLLGTEAQGGYLCTHCGKEPSPQNWMSFFAVLTRTEQLRSLDTWMKKTIMEHYYKCTGRRLKKTHPALKKLASLKALHYRYRKEGKYAQYCKCSPELARYKKKRNGQFPLAGMLYDNGY